MVSVCSEVLAELGAPTFKDGIEDRRLFVSLHAVSISTTQKSPVYPVYFIVGILHMVPLNFRQISQWFCTPRRVRSTIKTFE